MVPFRKVKEGKVIEQHNANEYVLGGMGTEREKKKLNLLVGKCKKYGEGEGSEKK